MEHKYTNPKDAIGASKLPLHLWPTTATAMGCIGLLEGALKYGRSNWRESGVRASIYVDACKRHLDAWFEGEECAPDSGSPHLANALACLAIIVDARAAGKLLDDRAYGGAGYRALVDELTPQVPRLKALFAEHNPHHYTIADHIADNSKMVGLDFSAVPKGATHYAAGDEGAFPCWYQHVHDDLWLILVVSEDGLKKGWQTCRPSAWDIGRMHSVEERLLLVGDQ